MGTVLKRVVVTMAALGIAAAASPAAAAATEPRIALVIGNAAYPNIGRLRSPANDAKLMARTLRDLGFEVRQWLNADQRTMKRAIVDFGARLEKAGKDAVGLFYYAGHGVQVRGTNYLIPMDTMISREADVEVEAVNANWVMTQMDFAGNPVNVIVLDSCRNNPFARSFRSANRGLAKGLAKMDAPRGSLLAYATAPGKVAVDGQGANSPYTSALAKAMTQPGLKLGDIFKRVRTSVMAATKDQQVPWETSSLTGDFFFKPKPPAPKVAAPAPQPSQETIFWQSVQGSGNPDAFRAYLEKYPKGAFAILAQANLTFLERKEKQRIEEQQRRERLRIEDRKRQEQEAQRRAELEREKLRLESERLRLLREAEAQRRAELEQKVQRLEAERLRLLREKEAAAARPAPVAAPRPAPAPSAAAPEVARAVPPAPKKTEPAAPPPTAGAATLRVALVLPPPTKRVKFGTVIRVKGWATAKPPNRGKGGLFERYDTFTTDRLQTNSTSLMHVAFSDGAMLRMGKGTDAVVESFGPNPETGMPGVALALTTGALRFTAAGTDPVAATVRTRSAVMRLMSTDFAVEVDQERTTRLVLVNGTGVIASTLGGPAVEVSAGVFVSVERDAPDAVFDRAPQHANSPESMVLSFKEDRGLSEKGRISSGSEGDGDGDDGDDDGDDGHD